MGPQNISNFITPYPAVAGPPPISPYTKLYLTVGGIGFGVSMLAFIFNWVLGKDENPVKWLGLIGGLAAGVSTASLATVLANFITDVIRSNG